MSNQKPKALWVQANPSNVSFNQHLFEAGVEALSENYEVATSDLYAMDFDARLSPDDLGSFKDQLTPGSSFIGLTAEAFAVEQLPEQVRQEQAKVSEADLLVFQFPLWWHAAPAMFKGWLDRVLSFGFAYGEDVDEATGLPIRYGDGKLAGRKALIVVTAGETAASMGPRGINGDIDTLMFPITHGTLWFTGIASYPVHLITETDMLSREAGKRETQRLIERLKDLENEETIPFRKLSQGQYSAGDTLNQEILPDRTDLGVHRQS